MASRLADREGEVLPVQKLTLTVESSSMLREFSPHIEVDLPNIQDMKVEQMSSKDFDKVKLALLALSEKASVITALEQEVKLLRAQAQANSQARVDLEQTLTETTEQLRHDALSQDQLLKTMQDERSKAILSLHEKHVESKKFEEESEVLKAALSEANRNLSQSRMRETLLLDVKSENEQLKRELADERKMKKEYVEEVEKLGNQLRAQSASFVEELTKQAKSREQLQGQIKDRESQQDQLRSEITALKVEIVTLNAQISTEKSLKARLADLESQCKVFESRCTELQKQSQSLQTTEQVTFQKTSETETRLLEEKKRLNETLTLVETELEVKQQRLQEMERELHEAKHNVATLEQLCCIKEDLHQLVEQITTQCEVHKSGKDVLLEELNYLSEQSLLVSQKSMEQARLLDRYAEMCESHEDEMDEMKLNVLQLQHRVSIYSPQKDDPVDSALAEFLNSRSEPLLVPFQRQDRDLYLFGTRRIFMKLENGRITVRVGGGFTRIEDFVEVYTPIELERTHARLAQSVTGQKKALGKLMSSVVGKSPMSPQKAARIIASAVEKGSTKYGTFFGVRKPSPKKSTASSPTKQRTPSERKSFTASDIAS